jgi:hypothetical protein
LSLRLPPSALGVFGLDTLEQAVELVLVSQGLDVVNTEYGKALGQGLYEFRLRWSAAEVRRKADRVSAESARKSEKIMLRMFFCTAGKKVILLLGGYDKAVDPSPRRQQSEIARARRSIIAYGEEQKRARKRS